MKNSAAFLFSHTGFIFSISPSTNSSGKCRHPFLQIEIHLIQLMHISISVWKSSAEIAFTGHSAEHKPQPEHLLFSNRTGALST